MSMKDWTGQYLSSALKNRRDYEEQAKASGERNDDFYRRFPRHRLYEIKAGAPYRATSPGCLVVAMSYRSDAIQSHEEMEDLDADAVIGVMRVRRANEVWDTSEGDTHWVAPKWLSRVDEEKYQVEINI